MRIHVRWLRLLLLHGLPYKEVWKNVAQSRRAKERARAAKRAREEE